MSTKKMRYVNIPFICIPLLTQVAQANECFNVALPLGAKEFRQPANLSFVQTSQGDMGTHPGFDIYHTGQNLALNGPACFVLDQDIVRHVDILARFLGESGGSGPMIELFGSDIVMDLNGHALRSNRASTAIETRIWGKLKEPRRRSLTFRNGRIEVGGYGIILIGWQYGGQAHNFKPSPDQLDTAKNWYGPNFREFGDTNIVLENLTIKSGGLAAYLVGRNNVIRHCYIEVEGHEAVALFGANNQLIDNEIIIKRSKSAPPEPRQPDAQYGSYYPEYAAIWVRDAPGLVIRGNKITIEGLLNAKEAIMLINSPGVIIENNTITGSDKLYTALDAKSSARTRDNRKRFGKWPND